MSGIGGNEPTGYSYQSADSLKTKADTLQSKLYGQQGSRSSAVWTAMQEFRGYYSEVFDRNAEIANDGRREAANALGEISRWVVELREAAEAEDQRREEARAWEERQRARESNALRAGWHDFTSAIGVGDDPQPPAPEEPPFFTSPGVSVSAREIQAPVGGSSTSSAAPEDLRHFQSRTGELDDELAGDFRDFEFALSMYEAYCNGRWGYLNAQSVLSALRDWFAANAEDASWAGQVAQAFEDAGSGAGVTTVADASVSAALHAAGSGVHQRDGLTIEPFSAVGTPPTTGFADDPVNTSTGNFLEPETDLSWDGAAASLAFTRMYNSLDDRTGVFGPGWSSILDTRLEFGDDGARFIMADGRQMDFPRAGAGWDRGVGENYWLDEDADRVLTVTDNTGCWWAFSPAGMWLGFGSGPGSAVHVVRDDAGQIRQLAHERGRCIDIEYIDQRVVSVSASDGRRIEYAYDDQRRLISVTDAVGTRSYRWNDAGLIAQVVSAAGVIECENVYDAQGRVIRQLTPYGRSVRFAYLRGRVTSVSTDDGTGANTWIADRKGRVVGIIDADGNRQSMAYDPHGNIVSATDRDGQVTVHAYDDRGRKIRTVTPDGADITYGYDEFDRVTTVVTAAGGVVEYEYATDVDRNPSVITDPAGGRSELTWEHGLLVRVVDPAGVAVSLDYDAFGELVAVRNATGDTARLVRDYTGRVMQILSPVGRRTKFRYSKAGLLIAREDPDGAIWRFEHGRGGVTTAVVDPYGHRTEFEYGDHGEIIRQVDPLGRVTTQDVDELGNLASVMLPDGAQWEYTHDALSRLRDVIDPAGNTWTRSYDVNGKLVSSVDPTGVRTDISRSRASNLETLHTAFEEFTLRTDEYGRPITAEQSDGSAELITYDVAGRPVECVDAEGGLTTVAYNLAGRITRITTPDQRTTHYEYDACGRPVVAIDPAGGRTVLEYDADSRVISRTNPAGEVSTAAYDAMGRVISEDIPGIGVARYRYDKLGRLVGVQDSRYGQRKFAYDAAGQLIKTTNGLGGVTRYEYDQRGRMIRMTDPADGVTTYTYTELDVVDSVTDPLHRVTRATYDAAGRKLSQTDPDGNVTEWTYDAGGREDSVRVNGTLITQITRDVAQRKTTVQDMTRGTQTPVVHELTYNRRGQLVHRSTIDDAGSHAMAWEYDVDGYRTAMTTAEGVRISYDRDRRGNIVGINHGTFGNVTYAYDAAGRLRQARAGELLQSWEYDNGYPVTHTETSAAGATVTRIVRDDQGRITEIVGPNGSARYSYDQACQLTVAITDRGVTTWTYDRAGRVALQTSPGGEYTYFHDRAGQLLLIKGPAGVVTTYEYDGRGQRIRTRAAERTTKYSWDPRGWLAHITEQYVDRQHTIDLSVNALGELSKVNDMRLQWDAAAGVPTLVRAGKTDVYQAPAGLTALGTDWSTTGWRGARSTDHQDPWQSLAEVTGLNTSQAQGPVGLAADGGLYIAGLEWMGARAYDPSSSSFLSIDPIPAPMGAGWAANPYSYAGNDPLHALDPHGLAPVTDAELQTYADGLQGPLASGFGTVKDFVEENAGWIGAGVMVVGGVALLATGVGGPAGIALMAAGGAAISGGASMIGQSQSAGAFDWGQVGTDALIGAAGTGGAGAVANGLTRGARALTPAVRNGSAGRVATTTHSVLRDAGTRGVVAGGSGGAISNTANYHFNTTGDRTVGGYAQSGIVGGLTGAGGHQVAQYLRPVSSSLGGRIWSTPAGRTPGAPGTPEPARRSAGGLTWGGTLLDQAGDRASGAVSSTVNEAFQPHESQGSDFAYAAARGLAQGGTAPTLGLHAK